MILIWTLSSVIAVSLLSLIGLASLFLKENTLRKLVFFLVSLSVGALLGDVLIHLIPEILDGEGLSNIHFAIFVFLGFLIFFSLEKFMRWRHTHGVNEECEETAEIHTHEPKPVGAMVLVADGVHNFIDGVIIAVSYMGGFEIGLATTIAVILHEIPQEMGDFGLLIHAGYTRKRALIWNFISSAFAILGALVAYAWGQSIGQSIPIALSLAAGGFIYIAASDLVPELQKTKNLGHSLIQIAAIAIGFSILALLLIVG